MTNIWKNIQDNIEFEKNWSCNHNSKVIIPKSYLSSLYWTRYLKLVYSFNLNKNLELSIKKKIICEVIYMMWIKKKLNSRGFNKVLFDPQYIGGYMIKQKIRQSLAR
jgi:hypothetical protein